MNKIPGLRCIPINGSDIAAFSGAAATARANTVWSASTFATRSPSALSTRTSPAVRRQRAEVRRGYYPAIGPDAPLPCQAIGMAVGSVSSLRAARASAMRASPA